jgi:hypothetical protein
LVGDKPLDRAARKQVADEPARAHRLLLGVLPATTFYQLLAGIEDGCDPERNLMLVKEFLPSIENAGMSVYPGDAPHFSPHQRFGEAFNHGGKFGVSTGEVLAQLTEPELTLENKNLWQPDL